MGSSPLLVKGSNAAATSSCLEGLYIYSATVQEQEGGMSSHLCISPCGCVCPVLPNITPDTCHLTPDTQYVGGLPLRP
jgi:hypothetical protein